MPTYSVTHPVTHPVTKPVTSAPPWMNSGGVPISTDYSWVSTINQMLDASGDPCDDTDPVEDFPNEQSTILLHAGSASARPTYRATAGPNGTPYAEFDGVANCLDVFNLTSSYFTSGYLTSFCVLRINTDTSGGVAIGIGELEFGSWQSEKGCSLIAATGTGGVGQVTRANGVFGGGGAANDIDTDTTTDLTTGWYIVSSHIDIGADSVIHRVNGVEESTDTAITSTADFEPEYFRMGASGAYVWPGTGAGNSPASWLHCDIAAWILYDRLLNSSESSVIQTFLNQIYFPNAPRLFVP